MIPPLFVYYSITEYERLLADIYHLYPTNNPPRDHANSNRKLNYDRFEAFEKVFRIHPDPIDRVTFYRFNPQSPRPDTATHFLLTVTASLNAPHKGQTPHDLEFEFEYSAAQIRQVIAKACSIAHLAAEEIDRRTMRHSQLYQDTLLEVVEEFLRNPNPPRQSDSNHWIHEYYDNMHPSYQFGTPRTTTAQFPPAETYRVDPTPTPYNRTNPLTSKPIGIPPQHKDKDD